MRSPPRSTDLEGDFACLTTALHNSPRLRTHHYSSNHESLRLETVSGGQVEESVELKEGNVAFQAVSSWLRKVPRPES